MKLDEITVAIRPRNAWEGIDLGFAMARRWFGRLWLLWILMATPALAVGLLLFDSPWALLLWIWWLKPAYEPALVYGVSRAVFGETPAVRAVLPHWRRFFNLQTLANLTYRRLAPSRSFYMPVQVLEGLKGRARAERIRVLGRGQQAGGWLTLTAMHFEWVLQFGFVVLVVLLVPEELQWAEALFAGSDALGEWLWALSVAAAASVIAPFYVAGGFALYLSRRIDLEAWDLELNFRRLAAGFPPRGALGRAALAAGFTLALGAGFPPPGLAAASPQQADALIQEVLADEAFGAPQEVGYWRYTGDGIEWGGDGPWWPDWMGGLIEFLGALPEVARLLLWVAAGVVLALLAAWLLRNRERLFRGRRRAAVGAGEAPAELFGLDLRQERLPDDPAAEALRLIAAGDPRAALSLLYRGALVRLIFDHGLEIPRSATEGECMQRVEQRCSAELSAFFTELTRHWRSLAYAHRMPQRVRLQRLAEAWGERFGRRHEPA